MSIEVQKIENEIDIRSAYSVMKELRTHLDEETYVDLVKEAGKVDRYHLYGLFLNNELFSVIGFKEMTTLYYGRFVWVCDLVTKKSVRSNGYGKELLNFVEKWAAGNGYETVALSSGLSRKSAHRFYEEKMDYKRVSYVFKNSV
ncbi:GNAT family N-acetyltransferase [Halobacillus litoralis]|uniref:GNAT family N-acetyltransferase n=1 Tax=Halobacillus litoralis TaxID=45668 RepID=UPI001CFCC99D|nr:GNAT family N-acetyltransferase [Halobacillus litoralis]